MLAPCGVAAPTVTGPVVKPPLPDSTRVGGGDGSIGSLQGHTDGHHPVLEGPNSWNKAQRAFPDRVQLVTVPRHPNSTKSNVLRVEWREGDPTVINGKRAELNGMVTNSGGSQTEEPNTTVYYACGLYLPDNFIWPKERATFWQMHGPGGARPPIRMAVHETKRLQLRVEPPSGGGSAATYYDNTKGALPKGGWIQFVWRVVWKSADGGATVWRRDPGDPSFIKVIDFGGKGTVYDHTSHKQGIYTSDDQVTTIQYFLTNVVRGTGFKAVAEECFGITVA
jgi:hypothetical protein